MLSDKMNKEDEECSFTPKINKTPPPKVKMNKIQGFTKEIERIQSARQPKQEKKRESVKRDHKNKII